MWLCQVKTHYVTRCWTACLRPQLLSIPGNNDTSCKEKSLRLFKLWNSFCKIYKELEVVNPPQGPWTNVQLNLSLFITFFVQPLQTMNFRQCHLGKWAISTWQGWMLALLALRRANQSGWFIPRTYPFWDPLSHQTRGSRNNLRQRQLQDSTSSLDLPEHTLSSITILKRTSMIWYLVYWLIVRVSSWR